MLCKVSSHIASWLRLTKLQGYSVSVFLFPAVWMILPPCPPNFLPQSKPAHKDQIQSCHTPQCNEYTLLYIFACAAPTFASCAAKLTLLVMPEYDVFCNKIKTGPPNWCMINFLHWQLVWIVTSSCQQVHCILYKPVVVLCSDVELPAFTSWPPNVLPHSQGLTHQLAIVVSSKKQVQRGYNYTGKRVGNWLLFTGLKIGKKLSCIYRLDVMFKWGLVTILQLPRTF